VTPSAKTVLAVGAHPDDVELLCAGTLALLKEKGWQIEIATMTPGDCGSAEKSREEISGIRRREAAAILNGRYTCLEHDDIFILYDQPSLIKTIALVRTIRPQLVFTHSPSDYMQDHETTSRLVQTACFSAGMTNIKTPGIESFTTIPFLYYLDPMEGKDIFGEHVKPSTIVDISHTIDTKEKMLICHSSQRLWLLQHHGIDEYIHAMKNFSRKRGKEINTDYAEGFRQHLGHAFPEVNLLKQELGDDAHLIH
jgi:LmbE family N-acetylglucosaminyl deacetylase